LSLSPGDVEKAKAAGVILSGFHGVLRALFRLATITENFRIFPVSERFNFSYSVPAASRRPFGLSSKGSSAASSLLNGYYFEPASSLFLASDPLDLNVDAMRGVETL
jgi:hypothetical protein